MYLIDRIEHGNCGVCGTRILDELPLEELLKKTPYSYGCGNKEWGFYPVICETTDENNPLYYWDDDERKWYKDK
jgi:hypothetical protein